ncbi:PREDICTED: probable protein arginine N-methyltransferase 3 isoform X1 [Brassica oleracea var. oleracea]|nr:PREDICTED: probable protein arginine N-methyltransferase 3 isoform X1 [Brassica oleracea var. oleracea]
MAAETKMVKDGVPNYSENDDEENFSEDGDWGDWEAADKDDDDFESDFVCLFCDSLFEHCRLSHGFDFHGVRKELKLDFYASFKLINYIRSQVAENKCWSWEALRKCHPEAKDVNFPWDEEKYLKPFLQEDSLLYSFADDEEEEDEEEALDREDLIEDLRKLGDLSIVDDEAIGESSVSNNDKCKDVSLISNCDDLKQSSAYGLVVNRKGKEPRVCDARLVGRSIRKVNENYFGSYNSFGIHREMISDKVRTDAYRDALLKNSSLMSGSVVMDVGCGTGILRLIRNRFYMKNIEKGSQELTVDSIGFWRNLRRTKRW